jgi:hypothetical protein
MSSVEHQALVLGYALTSVLCVTCSNNPLRTPCLILQSVFRIQRGHRDTVKKQSVAENTFNVTISLLSATHDVAESRENTLLHIHPVYAAILAHASTRKEVHLLLIEERIRT